MGREGENYAMVCKFGFIGLVAFLFVGADVPDGPFHSDRIDWREKNICGASRTSPPTIGSFELPDKLQFDFRLSPLTFPGKWSIIYL